MSETLNAQDIAKKLQEQLTSLSATVDTHEVSTVDEVGDGIARVSGLKSAMAGELLEFKSSDTGETVFGLAQNLGPDCNRSLLLLNTKARKYLCNLYFNCYICFCYCRNWTCYLYLE